MGSSKLQFRRLSKYFINNFFIIIAIIDIVEGGNIVEKFSLKDDSEVAQALSQMGHPARLKILRHAIVAGDSGICVGDLKDRLSIPGSTLTHHLQSLIKVGLIKQHRDKQTLYCVANYNKIFAISDYIKKDCCKGL